MKLYTAKQTKRFFPIKWVFAFSAVVLLSGCAADPGFYNGRAEVVIHSSPPPLRDEVIGVAPWHGAIWIRGHWARHGDDFVWRKGYWASRPDDDARWVPGHWVERRHDRWVWRPGHWQYR
jgi:hypothetical protein